MLLLEAQPQRDGLMSILLCLVVLFLMFLWNEWKKANHLNQKNQQILNEILKKQTDKTREIDERVKKIESFFRPFN